MTQPDDLEVIGKIQDLFEKTFGSEEVDPLEILQAAISGTKPFGSEENVYYRLYAAIDDLGNVQSVVAGGLLALLDACGERRGDAILMNAYAATDITSKRRGLFTELYISLLVQAAIDATAQRLLLCAAAGECTWTSEAAWNAVGQARVYLEFAPNIFKEVPYIQPPVHWAPSTGLPAEGAGDVPEHLMLEMFADPPNKIQFFSMVDAIYGWNNRPREEYFASRDAYLVHKSCVDRLEQSLRQFVCAGNALSLLSATERSIRTASGASIEEHTAADANG